MQLTLDEPGCYVGSNIELSNVVLLNLVLIKDWQCFDKSLVKFQFCQWIHWWSIHRHCVTDVGSSCNLGAPSD